MFWAKLAKRELDHLICNGNQGFILLRIFIIIYIIAPLSKHKLLLRSH